MKEFYKEIGSRIQRFRTAKSFSQEELSKKLKISRVTILNIENGSQKLTIDRLLEISKALEVSPLDLVLELNIESKIDHISASSIEDGSQDLVISELDTIKRKDPN